MPTEKELREAYARWEPHKLAYVLKNQRQEYTPEALLVMEEIARERGVGDKEVYSAPDAPVRREALENTRAARNVRIIGASGKSGTVKNGNYLLATDGNDFQILPAPKRFSFTRKSAFSVSKQAETFSVLPTGKLQEILAKQQFWIGYGIGAAAVSSSATIQGLGSDMERLVVSLMVGIPSAAVVGAIFRYFRAPSSERLVKEGMSAAVITYRNTDKVLSRFVLVAYTDEIKAIEASLPTDRILSEWKTAYNGSKSE